MTMTPDPGRLMKRIKEDAAGAQRAGMINLVATIEALAVKSAPKKTSNLARTRTTSVFAAGSRGTIAFTAPYAGFVHEGTGLYGPHKTKIVPKSKQALFWPGAGHPVRAVKGMKARPWLKIAAGDVKVDEVFQEGMQNYLKSKGD